MTRLLPVLTDNTKDAMVLGFSKTEVGALRIAKKWFIAHGTSLNGISIVKEGAVKLQFHPDLHTESEVRRANLACAGYIVNFKPGN